MSLCQACRKALPNIPESGGDEHLIATTSKKLSEHGDWKISPFTIPEEWHRTGFFLLHTSWESLVLSLSDDCPICWTIWRSIRSSPIASPDYESVRGFKAEITDILSYPGLHKYVFEIYLNHRIHTRNLRFILHKTTEKHYLEAETEFPLAIQHTPESAACVANRWIKTCEAEHSRCLRPATPPKHANMPARLLDLGNGSSNSWRLCQDPGRVPYAALSHRWSSDTPELHTNNYQNYCNFQPDNALPQSYQDIISICRAIPIQYLWIDSLCIIQDDNGHEFTKEAPIMRDIYQYAILTLSICWDFPGLSIFRKCRPRTIPRPQPLGHFEKHHCVSELDGWVFAKESGLKELTVAVNKAPINKRAWVLQERCLSRRLLYLGNDQLYWECDGCTGSEASPHCIDKVLVGRQSILDLTGPRKDMAWGQTLRQYTASDLTFESDRLIAIAGLAKSVADKTGGMYFAGIWLDSWMKGLLWEPFEKKNRNSKLKPEALAMVSPSWSWLAFSGSVIPGDIMCGEGPKISVVSPNSFKSDEYQPLALLSQAKVIPPTSDPFSFFQRAILSIRCLLLPVTFVGIAQWNEETPWFSRHEYDIDLSSKGLDCFRLQACEPFDDSFISFRFCFSQPVDNSLQYYLLPLYRRQDPNPKPSYPPSIYGLVLQRGLSEGSEEYTRVGMWYVGYRYSSQLSPMISNTIVKLGLGKSSTFGDGSLKEDERIFDLKLGEYAASQVDSKVLLPMKVIKDVIKHRSDIVELDEKASVPGSEATEQEVDGAKEKKWPGIRYEEVECSLLPHFSTAEWGTICLV